jgi:hypothetical protein
LYQRLQCRDKYFFKIKFVFFLYLRLSASSKEYDLPLCIYFWYQTDSGVPNTSIYSAVSLASPYYNYLSSTASTTMIYWRCHSNSVNTGSRLPICSDVKTRKRRNVVGIDMIRNNRIGICVLSDISLTPFRSDFIYTVYLYRTNVHTNIKMFIFFFNTFINFLWKKTPKQL